MTFGEKLQKLRKERGLSQEQLAEQITVSRQALSKWELGTSIPDTENVLQLSKLFGVSTDYLLNDDYTSDNDLPAVRVENEKLSRAYRNKIRVIVGSCLSGLSALGMLALGICSSIYPATYGIAAAGADWGREYTGLIGFLKSYHLEWLFALCIILFVAGVATILYSCFHKRKS